MNCDKAKETLIEALSGPLEPRRESDLERHLASCSACGEEAASLGETWRALSELEGAEAPSDRMRVRFRAALGSYEASLESSLTARLGGFMRRLGARAPVMSPAAQAAFATLFLVVGLFVGWGSSLVFGAGREVSELRSEMASMSRAVTLSLLEHQSASERLRGVSWSSSMEPDDRVLAALVEAVQSDESVNVRLAAVEALGAHLERPMVRSGLLRSLEGRPEPHLQMAVSRLFASEEAGSRREIERLLSSDLLDPEVRRLLTQESDEI